jgi:hypothetical protein
VFIRLSSVAVERSLAIRREAEEYLSRVIADRVAEVTREEAVLRQQVEALWRTFREPLQTPDGSRVPEARPASATSSSKTVNTNATPARDAEFLPIRRVSAPLVSRSHPRSALSASLSTSSFHHPGAAISTQNTTTKDHGSFSALTDNSSTGLRNESRARGPYRRNMSEDLDIVTSYKYAIDIGEEMERRAALLNGETKAPNSDAEPTAVAQKLPSPPTSPTRMKSSLLKSATKSPSRNTQAGSVEEATTGSKETSPAKTKTKRKVTFDMQPEVMAEDKPSVGSENRNAEESMGHDGRFQF